MEVELRSDAEGQQINQYEYSQGGCDLLNNLVDYCVFTSLRKFFCKCLN